MLWQKITILLSVSIIFSWQKLNVCETQYFLKFLCLFIVLKDTWNANLFLLKRVLTKATLSGLLDNLSQQCHDCLIVVYSLGRDRWKWSVTLTSCWTGSEKWKHNWERQNPRAQSPTSSEYSSRNTRLSMMTLVARSPECETSSPLPRRWVIHSLL